MQRYGLAIGQRRDEIDNSATPSRLEFLPQQVGSRTLSAVVEVGPCGRNDIQTTQDCRLAK